MRPPVIAEPAHVALDRVDIFLLLAGRVGVVETQVAAPAEFLGDPEIQRDRLGVADMEVAVGLGRKAGDDGRIPPGGDIRRHDVADEIAPCFRCRGFRHLVPVRLPPPSSRRLCAKFAGARRDIGIFVLSGTPWYMGELGSRLGLSVSPHSGRSPQV